MTDLINRSFGYAIEKENVPSLMDNGHDPEIMLMSLKAAYPEFNPYAPPYSILKSQGSQGSCQGHSLAQAAQINLFQKTGFQLVFSRACAYYESQRFDRINGDRGSTLSGGQKAAAAGLMLETDWPYPIQYSNARPANFATANKLKFTSSTPIDDPDLIFELIKAGAVIQTGVMWTDSFERPICDTYSTLGGRGGHSCYLNGLHKDTEHIIHHNSWGPNWQNKGRNLWTLDFLKRVMQNDNNSVFVAYESTGVEFNISEIQ